MPLEPVRTYDEPGYPTLESDREARRAFLRSIGLAAIAAAFGPTAGCGAMGGDMAARNRNSSAAKNSGGDPPKGPQDPIPLAGTPLPPKWPGPTAALVGGSPIPVTYSGGEKGWVALAVVFDPENVALEDVLLGLEVEIAAETQKRLSQEPMSAIVDLAKRESIEKDLLATLRRMAKNEALLSATLAVVSDEAARTQRQVARPAPTPPAQAPSAPAATPAPPAAASPEAAAAPARKRLPRAGDKCAVHPNGCAASDAG